MTRIAIKYGILMFAGFTAFFLLMYMLGLSQHSELRAFNGIIHLILLYFAIREYRVLHPDSAENAVSGVSVGLATSMVGSVAFAIFVAVFLGAQPALLAALQSKVSLGENLNPVAAAAFITVEGTVIGLIGSYILARIIDGPVERYVERKEQPQGGGQASL